MNDVEKLTCKNLLKSYQIVEDEDEDKDEDEDNELIKHTEIRNDNVFDKRSGNDSSPQE